MIRALSRNKHVVPLKTRLRMYRWMYLFLAPAVILTFFFAYLPMFGNLIAFMDYKMTAGWMGMQSPFVGLKWFQKFLTDPTFYKLLWNTLYYSVVVIFCSNLLPFVFALLINELRNKYFKKSVQTLSYLPHFISWVTMASLVYYFLSTDTSGIINNIRETLFGLERIIFMKFPGNFVPVMATSFTIKEIGWYAIIYLAALANLDPQLYEAASIDGATRIRQVISITIPSILPTVTVLFIMSMGSLMAGGGFDMVFNLQNEIIRADTDTLAVYTYYKGIRGGQYSLTAAIGLFNGLVNFLLVIATDFISKKLTSYGLF